MESSLKVTVTVVLRDIKCTTVTLLPHGIGEVASAKLCNLVRSQIIIYLSNDLLREYYEIVSQPQRLR